MVEWGSLILLGDPNSPLAPRRPTNGGGTPIPLALVPSSPCVPVGRSGCTLLGGLDLMLNLTVVEIGVYRVEIPHPIACSWLALSQSRRDQP